MQRILRDLDSEGKQKFLKLAIEVRNVWKIPEDQIHIGSIYRFFSACEFNYTKAAIALKQHIKWRSTYCFSNAINLEKEVYAKITQHAKIGVYGTDKSGRPIGIIKPVVSNPFAIFNQIDEKKIVDYQIQMFERMINIVFPLCSQKADKNINSIICLIDLKGVSLYHLLFNPSIFQFVIQNMSVYRENYPELSYKGIVINTCPGFFYVWKIIKVFMQPKTLEKITILNHDYINELLKYTTIDKIPKSLGGTCPFDIEEFPNFFNDELEKSVKEKRLTMEL